LIFTDGVLMVADEGWRRNFDDTTRRLGDAVARRVPIHKGLTICLTPPATLQLAMPDLTHCLCPGWDRYERFPSEIACQP